MNETEGKSTSTEKKTDLGSISTTSNFVDL